MDPFAAKIETLEHGAMRAWMQRDRNHLKAVAERDFMFLLGSRRAVILDRASWLEAVTTRFTCTAYRFGDVYVRRHGKIALFAARLELDGALSDRKLTGDYWLSDVWRRSPVRRNWRLIERSLSRPDNDEALPDRMREMQLWR